MTVLTAYAAAAAEWERRAAPPKGPLEWAAEKGIDWWSAQRAIAASVEQHKRTVVRAGHAVGKCTTFTSMIPLSDGTVRDAKDLIGRCFVIQAWTEDGSQYPSIAWASDNGTKPVYRITTSSGRSIERTGNHPLYAARRAGGGSGRRLHVEPAGWTALGELAAGDLVLVPEQLHIAGRQRADDADVKLLGYLLGDGSTTINVGFTQQEGPAKDEFRKLVAGYGCQAREHPANKHGLIVAGPDGERFGRKASNPVINRVRDWGLLGCKATAKRFPDWAWRLPNGQLALLLNRLFACDGWATVPSAGRPGENVSIAIGLASEGMIRDVEMAMLRLGILGTVRARTSAYDNSGRRFGSWVWSIHRLEDMRRFRDVVGILGKEDAVNRAIARKESWHGRASHWMRSNAPRGYRWEMVKDVEALGEQPTVCISVPAHHTYLTTFVEHNSYTAACLAAWWVDTKPDSMVITTAPTYDQVHGILWEEIRALHGKLGLPGHANATDEWKIGGRQVGIGRKPPDSAKGSDFDPATFQGYHRRGGVLVILDEASGVPEWLWNAVETVTTTDNCRILAIGNPDNPGSHFAKVCQPGHPGWVQHKISVFDSPNFTGEPVPAEVSGALVTRGWQEDRLAEWGEDDYKYISKVLAEFPSDHPRQVVSIVDLLACQFPEPRSATELVPVELGVDVGGGGDETVIRERRGIRAGRQWVQKSDRPEDIGRLVLRAINETGATSVKIDSIGVGAGVVGELRNLRARGDHDAQIHGVNVAEQATDPVKYLNRRAQLWWEIGRVGSQAREWDLSAMEDAERTVAQLLWPRYEEDAKGRIQIEKKDDIRARTGGSPDRAEALLLAYHVPRDAQAAYFQALISGKLGR